jgi:hypothetical protein
MACLTVIGRPSFDHSRQSDSERPSRNPRQDRATPCAGRRKRRGTFGDRETRITGPGVFREYHFVFFAHFTSFYESFINCYNVRGDLPSSGAPTQLSCWASSPSTQYPTSCPSAPIPPAGIPLYPIKHFHRSCNHMTLFSISLALDGIYQ